MYKDMEVHVKVWHNYTDNMQKYWNNNLILGDKSNFAKWPARISTSFSLCLPSKSEMTEKWERERDYNRSYEMCTPMNVIIPTTTVLSVNMEEATLSYVYSEYSKGSKHNPRAAPVLRVRDGVTFPTPTACGLSERSILH